MRDKLKTYSKGSHCPVCGSDAGGCRETSTGGVLCHTWADASLHEVIDGYDGQRWRCNQTATGHTATFGLYTGFSKSQSAENIKRREEREKAAEEEKARAIANEMPAGDRDEIFKNLGNQLGLNAGDRQNLLGRGFTDSQIENCGFFSVGRYPKVGELPPNFPGYDLGNESLIISGAGILCPIPDYEGNLVGAQIRLAEVGEDEGRYRWLPGCHLRGEMPIACWDNRIEQDETEIWAIEGTSIKPALAHFKLGKPVIGASGGLFASSPQNFRRTWEHLSKKYATNKLVVAIDAGDVVNPSVVSRLRKQFVFFAQLGCDVRIAWWNQVEKGAGDIDEIADFSKIEYLSVKQFEEILKQYKDVRDAKVRSRGKQEVRSEEVRSDEAQLPVRSPLPNHRPLGWPEWLQLRHFTPDIVQASHYVQFDVPAPGTILAVRSGLGSGKTHQLQALFEKGGAFEDKGAIALFSRNSLSFNFIDRIPTFSHLNEENQVMIKDPKGRLCLCTNSLKKFSNPGWFDGKILVIDEFSSVSKHIACSSTHRKDRLEALELWREAFVRCESVILLDGNLTDWQVEWAAKQAPDKRVVKLQNTYKSAKAKVEILLGTPTKSGKFDATKLSPFVAPMVAANEPFIVFSDSQKLLEQLEELFKTTDKIGLRIDSKTIRPNSEERKFLNNCNKWVNEHKPDYILLSPTAESGVDISNNKLDGLGSYFPHSYGLFRGIIATDEQMQMMARYRDVDCFWHISVPKQSFLRSSDKDYDLSTINAAADKLMELAEMDISHLRLNKDWLGEQFLKYIEEAHSNHNVAFALKNRAKERFEKDNLRECLIFALEDAGHEVSQSAYFADGKIESQLKEAGELVKERASKEIFEADDIDDKMAEELAASWNCTWEDRVKVIKAGYNKLLPGIARTEYWTQELIRLLKYEKPKLIAGTNLLYQFQNPEISEKKQKNTWAKIATEKAVFLPDLFSPFLKVKALQFLGFEKFLNPENSYHKDSLEIQELVKLGNRKRVKESLGIAPQKNRKGQWDAMKYLSRLLEMVGLKLGACQQIQKEGKRINCYAIDATWLADPVRCAIATAVERRYQEFDAEWVLPEVLQVQVQEVSSQESEVNSEPEPETDADGIDWRGVACELKKAFGGLVAGSKVDLVSQPQQIGEKIMVWARSAIGQIRLEWGLLSLYFE